MTSNTQQSKTYGKVLHSKRKHKKKKKDNLQNGVSNDATDKGLISK